MVGTGRCGRFPPKRDAKASPSLSPPDDDRRSNICMDCKFDAFSVDVCANPSIFSLLNRDETVKLLCLSMLREDTWPWTGPVEPGEGSRYDASLLSSLLLLIIRKEGSLVTTSSPFVCFNNY